MKNNYYKLFLLISSLYKNGYCQEIDWNTINDNEEWDVLAYKRPVSKRNIALSLSMLKKALINLEIKPETLSQLQRSMVSL